MKSAIGTLTPRLGLELAAFAAVIVADAFGLVPLTLTVGLLPVVWILLVLARKPWSSIVGSGEKGYQFGGRDGARCGVTLWPI
jgi:hypothetical protein